MILADRVRVLVVPGLNDSSPAHWQSWLELHFRGSLRVRQHDWSVPDVDRWSARIDSTLASQPPARWIGVAHSFGCLALARHLAQRPPLSGPRSTGVRAALFVAPADPARFGIEDLLPHARLAVPSALLASESDPWMPVDSACAWGARVINLGDVGHINAESGFGPLPLAKAIVARMGRRLAGERRIADARAAELSFAVGWHQPRALQSGMS